MVIADGLRGGFRLLNVCDVPHSVGQSATWDSVQLPAEPLLTGAIALTTPAPISPTSFHSSRYVANCVMLHNYVSGRVFSAAQVVGRIECHTRGDPVDGGGI